VVEITNEAAKGNIKGLYIMGENPMVSDPNLNHVEEALNKIDFLVVQDIFMTETAQLADVVLPAYSSFEKTGTFTNTERRVQLLTPILEAPGDAREDWWIIQEISKRMGYEMNFKNQEEILNEVSEVTPIYGGMHFSRLGVEGLQWPCKDEKDPGTKYLHKDKFSKGLGLFSPVDYIPPAELPDNKYPYLLSTGRILFHYHTGTMSRKVKVLNDFEPGPYAEISTEIANTLGISDGEDIKISSRRGTIITKARVTDKVAPESVFIPFHFAEAAANRLTNDALDPVAKIPEFKVAACKIEKL
ncbi:MAG: formate dehydrogenase subunit alpha, partial [Thermoplasmata archaeon]